jgi:isoleucyl-tRNA synthetase
MAFVYKGLRAVYWCMHDETALAEAEVEYENAHQSHGLGEVRAARRSGEDRSRARRQESQHHHLDDDSLDAARLYGGAFRSRRRVCRARIRRRGLHRRQSSRKDAAEKCGLANTRENLPISRAQTRATQFQHPFLDRKVLGVLADYVTMDTGTGVVHTAPSHGAEDFITGVKYGSMPPATSTKKASFATACPNIKASGVGGESAHHRSGQKPRRAAAHGENRALLSSLLALPQSHHLPRHRAVVHLDGNAHARRPGKRRHAAHPHAQRNQEGEMGSGVGRRAHLQHDSARPDWCISRQRVWGVPIAVFLCEGCGKPLNDHAINRKVVELFARSGADAWFTLRVRQHCARRNKVPALRRHKVRKGNRHLRRLARIGSKLSCRDCRRARLSLALRSLPRRRRPVSRMVPVFAALRHGHARARLRIAASVTPGWTLDEKGPGHVEVARQRRRSGRHRQTAWAERSCASGPHQSTSAKT